LPGTDFQACRLFVPYIRCDVMLALQLGLQKADDTVVLELLSDRPNQNRTQETSAERGIVAQLPDACIGFPSAPPPRPLDGDLFWLQNDAVIAAAESFLAESATKTILIVDDDRSVADTFARMLKLEGFDVATASNAEAGLELASNVRPNAIILDMRMPITNGLQFLRLVRAKPHLLEVPVAIVTGDYFLPDPVQQELNSLGASIRFKPMWLEDLVALAKTLVA
jgi:CheY-like chemotaxis protein